MPAAGRRGPRWPSPCRSCGCSRKTSRPQKERYVDRAEAVETHRREADYILDSLRAVPAAYATTFAEQLHITPDLGREILDRFMALVLAELGDIRRQAVRDAERA